MCLSEELGQTMLIQAPFHTVKSLVACLNTSIQAVGITFNSNSE